MTVVIANAITGPATPQIDLRDWIEDQFRKVLVTLNDVAGISAFHLRRLTQPEGAGVCLYVSTTIWDDMSSFLQWWNGEPFKAAHHGCMTHQSDSFRRLTSGRYDIPDPAATTVDYLDELILARLREDPSRHPGLCLDGGPGFTEVLTWVTKAPVAASGLSSGTA
jgi:heme-degrading monooxygenase HmoA